MANVSQVAIISIQQSKGLQLFGKSSTGISNANLDVACSVTVNGQVKLSAVYARRISARPDGRKTVQFYDDISSFGKLTMSFDNETLILLVAAPADALFDDDSKSVSLRFEFKPQNSAAGSAKFFSNVSLRKQKPFVNFMNDATTSTSDNGIWELDVSLSRLIGSLRTYTVFVNDVNSERFPPAAGTFSRVNKIYEVGHRGCGKSFDTKCNATNAFVTENTVASFNYAAKVADFIEFDVIVGSRGDKIPFVYHDWYVAARTRRRDASQVDLVQHRTVDFLHSELASLALEHETALTNASLAPADPVPADFNATDDEKRPFETLQQMLATTTPELGVNLEIKYPILESKTGSLECDGFIDRNAYVDAIIAVLERDAKRREALGQSARRVIITSFDPDTCALATLKQSRYPVAYLAPYNGYFDWRQADIDSALAYAISLGFYGLVCDSAELPTDEEQLGEFVAYAGTAKLRIWTWGALNLNEQERKKQIRASVEGIIIDRVYAVNTTVIPD